jgi:arginyl-tRNA--protein-N-Asp/Glu arginylyltransferase
MSYKSRFKPFQLFINGQWHAFRDTASLNKLLSENFTR